MGRVGQHPGGRGAPAPLAAGRWREHVASWLQKLQDTGGLTSGHLPTVTSCLQLPVTIPVGFSRTCSVLHAEDPLGCLPCPSLLDPCQDSVISQPFPTFPRLCPGLACFPASLLTHLTGCALSPLCPPALASLLGPSIAFHDDCWPLSLTGQPLLALLPSSLGGSCRPSSHSPVCCGVWPCPL